MKVYINQNFNNKINSYNNHTSPIAKKKGLNISGDVFLIDKYNDYNVNFGAKQSVTKTITAEKTKLLRNLSDLLSTNVPELSAEEKAYKLMRKSIAFAKATAKRVDELYFQADAISQNKSLTPKQRLDSLREMKKEVERLEKLKMPKEDPPKKADDRIDFALINLFKSSISNNDFDLKSVFLDYYKDLENIKTIDELKTKYSQIKVPSSPVEVLAKRTLELLDRDFYEDLYELFNNGSSTDDIVSFLSERFVPILNNIIIRSRQGSIEFQKNFTNSFIRTVLNSYDNVVEKFGFSSIPIERKQTEIPLSEIDIALLHVDYDDFVLNTLRQHYLNGTKFNDMSYKNDVVEFTLNELRNSDYKFEKVSEKVKKFISDSEKIKSTQRDYKNYSLEELKSRLEYYANTEYGSINEIFDIIADFDGCQYTPEDMRYMVKFLRELDNITDYKMSANDAIKSIKDKDLRPHGTDKINAAEREKIIEKIKKEQQEAYKLKENQQNFDNAIMLLYKNDMPLVAEMCTKYYPKTLESNIINDANKIIKIITNNLAENKTAQQIEAKIMQWEIYQDYVKNDIKNEAFIQAKKYADSFEGIDSESRIGQYLWNREIIENYPKNKDLFLNPEILDKIVEKFGCDIDLATRMLLKYDNYMLMSSKDKTSMLKILEIFDYKNPTDKIVLKYIVENEYVKTDTSMFPVEISNQIKTEERIIASVAKEQILDKYKYPLCVEFFKAFEEALPLDAKAQGSSGVKKTGRNNDKLVHKVELKANGHNDRLFSSKNNYYFDIFSEIGLH